VNETDPPVPGSPILYRPETFDRHDAAVRYVEGLIQTRAPVPGSGRFADSKPGAWGLLASGHTIGSGSGLTLGSGTVTLCTLEGYVLTDTGQSVTVYNSGAPITASYGDKVVALEWTEAGWSACECGAEPIHCGPCCTTCLPCDIPNADLTLTIGYTATTLHYSPATDETTASWSDGTHTLACTGGHLTLSGGGSWTLGVTTCNPFGATFAAGYDTAVITGPAYGATTCCQTFTVRGCGPGSGCFVVGSVVTVKESSDGATLATGTIGTSGRITLLWAGSCSVYVTATDPSGSGTIVPYAQSLTLTSGGTTNITLPPTSGFHCFSPCSPNCCYQALEATLTATVPTGTVTLTWQSSGSLGAGWYGITSWTPPAGKVVTSCFPSTNQCNCGSATLHMGWYFDGCTMHEFYGIHNCQLNFGCGGIGTTRGYIDITLTGGTFAPVTPTGCLSAQSIVESASSIVSPQVCYPFSATGNMVPDCPAPGAYSVTP
jgi:hypothetical protein